MARSQNKHDDFNAVLNLQRNSSLVECVLNHPETCYWSSSNYTHSCVQFKDLPSYSHEYQHVSNLFNKTSKKNFKVKSVERIQNPFLMAGFLLKKEEMTSRLGHSPEVLELFHGTKNSFAESIAIENFDWRKHGETRGFKFGRGVSFSPLASYAANYSSTKAKNRTMFLVKVLVGEICNGHSNMVLPEDDCDTSKKPNGQVIVKYEDNEFYPSYKIIYNKKYY